MIAKIRKGEHLYGAISYNNLKVEMGNGEILMLHNLPERLDNRYSTSYLAQCFTPYLAANLRTEKPVRHISLNPDPTDKVSDAQYEEIAKEYMDGMGYGNQPYVVFKHTDTSRTHIHIVTVCVGVDGKKLPDSYDHPKSMAICRDLENKFNLIPATEKQRIGNEQIFQPVDYKSGDIKSQIAAVVRYLPKYYHYQSLGAYNALLSLFNITSEEVKGEIHGQPKNGLVYFALDQNGKKAGNPFKSSLFGKNAGLNTLLEHVEISKGQMKNSATKAILKDSIEAALYMTKTEADFRKQLIEQAINVVVRRNDEGRIYGITFIDHESRSVWNGSQLGKELSANVFNAHWKDGFNNSDENSQSHSAGQSENAENTNPDRVLHQLFDFIDDKALGNLTESFVDSIGSLIPGAQGDDYEEMEFENWMKKKKKIRKKKL